LLSKWFGKNNSKQLPVFFFVLMFSVLFTNCSRPAKPALDVGEGVEGPVETRWNWYGAYYENDELVVSVATHYFFNSVSLTYSVNKRIKILTTDGAKYGTLIVPRYTDRLDKFTVRCVDSTGKSVQFDLKTIKKEYLKTGKIVVPRVTAGCRISVFLVFSSDKILTNFEYWPQQDIPIKKGRFTFTEPSSQHYYVWKGYGSQAELPAREESEQGIRSVSWHFSGYEPVADEKNQPWRERLYPHVSIAVRYNLYLDEQYKFGTWRDLAEQYKRLYTNQNYLLAAAACKKTIESISTGTRDRFEKAQAVLGWVKKTISLRTSPFVPTDVRGVIKNGQGNTWEIAVVLNELFRSCGFQSDVLLTRAHSYGGFDSSFVSRANCDLSIVEVTIGEKRYCAFPFDAYSFLGQYDADFLGLQGLNVRTGVVEPVPPPLFLFYKNRTELTLDLMDPSGQHLHRVSTGFHTYTMRQEMSGYDKKQKEVYARNEVVLLDELNSLDSFAISGLDSALCPITVDAFFNLGRMPVKKGIEMIFLCGDFFRTKFGLFDGKRKSPFQCVVPEDCEENLTVMKKHGKKIRVDARLCNTANKLFICKDTMIETDSSYIISRRVFTKAVTLSAQEVNALNTDIQEMNNIKQTTVIIK
jgi:hypothetical protein